MMGFVRAVLAITVVPVFVSVVCLVTASELRTAASAFAMPMKHAMIKSIFFLILNL